MGLHIVLKTISGRPTRLSVIDVASAKNAVANYLMDHGLMRRDLGVGCGAIVNARGEVVGMYDSGPCLVEARDRNGKCIAPKGSVLTIQELLRAHHHAVTRISEDALNAIMAGA